MTSPSSVFPADVCAGVCTGVLDVPLPRGLREEADGMLWEEFAATYGHGGGPLKLGHWECVDAQRPATRLGPQARTYQATLAIGDRIATSTAAASGPIAALTAMLHEHGIALEMLRFHQRESGEQIATFIHGSNGVDARWALGLAQDPAHSALRAVIACANRLLDEQT